ncbi:hypothetical protein ACX9VS_08720 [Weissella paramesenteroides]
MTQKAQALVVPDGRSTKSSIVAKLKLADLELTLYSGADTSLMQELIGIVRNANNESI